MLRLAPSPIRFLPLSFALAAFLSPLSASAQSLAASTGDGFHATVGLGATMLPRYPGSGDARYVPFPLLSLSYNRFFFGAGQVAGSPALAGGVKLLDVGGVTAGVFVGHDLLKTRKSDDIPILRGTGDIDGTAWAGAFAKYQYGRFSASAAVRQDVGGKHQGLVGNLAADVTFKPFDRLALDIGPRLQLSSGTHMNALYGIDSSQSAVSGLPSREVKGGLEYVGLAVGLTYSINKKWFAGVRSEVRVLPGNMTDNPIVEKRTQVSVATFVGYNF
ncbi:MipA/OmpV family protein [Cupriavidus basilensis]